MVTFLITSVLLLGLFAIAIYFWQKPANQSHHVELPPRPDSRGLFDYDQDPNQLAEAAAIDEEARRKTLTERATHGDLSALQEAHQFAGRQVYDDVLDTLVARIEGTESPSQLLALASHVTRHELPVNAKLAAALIDSWRDSPDRSSTAKMLHLAALSDDPKIYQTAAESAMKTWRGGGLPDISAPELQAILEGEFWILSSPARSSGPGFVLKRSLAAARRELQTSHAAGRDQS